MYKLINIQKCFSVDGQTFTALSNINLTLPDVGFVGIVGLSGSGKSTLLNILASYDKPSSGKVFYNNFCISDAKEKELFSYRRNIISVLFQESVLIDDMTVSENIGLPLNIARYEKSVIKETVVEMCKDLGIEQLLNKYPSMLSGGEKQRVGLARSLITNPDVLLCDECTSGLDNKNAIFVMRVLRKLSAHKLIVLVSHQQRLVDKYCDSQVRLKNGNIIENTIDKNFKKKEKSNYKKTKKSRSIWTFNLALKYFKENIKRNSFAMISCCICFFMSFVGIGFIFGSPDAIKAQECRSLNNGYCLVAKRDVQNIDNSSLSLVKNTVPDTDEVKAALGNSNNIAIVDNLAFVCPESGVLKLDKKEKKIKSDIYPLYTSELGQEYKKLLIEGKTFPNNSFDYCYVNEEFEKNAGESCVNKIITLEHHLTFKDKDEIIDKVININFKVAGVVKELSFLNSPHVYYSYKALLNYSRTLLIDSIPAYTRIKNAEVDSPIRSFSNICFAKNKQGINLIKELNNKTINDIEFNSVFFTTVDAFTQLMKSINSCIIPFLVMNALIIVVFISFVTYSSMIEKQKDVTIIRSYGASHRDVSSIFSWETFLVTGLAFLLNVLSYKFVERKLNVILLRKTGIANLIIFPYANGSLFPFKYIVLSAILVCVIVWIVCYIFTAIKGRDSLSMELKK